MSDEEKLMASDWTALRQQKEYDLGAEPLTKRERGQLRMLLEESERRKWLITKTKTLVAWLAGISTATAAVLQMAQGVFRK